MDSGRPEPDIPTFIDLFTSMRNPSGDAGLVAGQLFALYAVPQSVSVLFALASDCSDATLREYAIYGILTCLKEQKATLDPAIIAATRQSALEILSREQEAGPQRAVVSVVSFLFQAFDAPWPELFAFMYGGTENMLCVLDLFSQIAQKIPIEYVQENIQFTVELVRAGLAEADPRVCVPALDVMFQLIVRLETVDPFVPFRELAMNVFKMGIMGGDAQIFSDIQRAVGFGLSNEQPYFRLCDVLPLLVGALQSSDFDISFKMSVNAALFSFLERDDSNTLTQELQEQLLRLEIMLMIEFFPYSAQEKSLLWSMDNGSIIGRVFMKMSDERVFNISLELFDRLCRSASPAERLAGIVVLNEAVFLNPSTFDRNISQLFSALLHFLGDPDRYVAQMAAQSLGSVANRFTDLVTDNLPVIVEAVKQYMDEQDHVMGISLLSWILGDAANTDSVFSLIGLLFELLKSSEALIIRSSIVCIYCLITRSDEQLPRHAEEIYTEIMNLLRRDDSAKYADLFDILGQLCVLCTEAMKDHMQDIVGLVVAGLNSNDMNVERAAIDLVPRVLRLMLDDMNDGVVQWVRDTYNVLHALAVRTSTKGYEDLEGKTFYTICGEAVLAMSCITANYTTPDFLDFLPDALHDMMTVLSTGIGPCITGAARGFQCITDVISCLGRDNTDMNQKYSGLINHFIDLLSDPEAIIGYDSSVIREVLRAIALAMKKCGVDIVEHRWSEMIANISNHLSSIIDNVCGEIVIHEDWLKPISEIFALMADTTSTKTAEEVLSQLVPFLNNLMNHKLQPLKSFAIDVFADLMSKKVTLNLLPAAFKASLLQTMLQIVAGDRPLVARSAAKFFAMLSKHEDGRPLVEEMHPQILQELVNRLQAECEPTNDVILMHEALIYAIGSIIHNVAAVSEDKQAFVDLLMLVLPKLPVRKDYQVAGETYRFVNSLFHLSASNEPLRKEFIRVFVGLFGRSKSQFQEMALGPLVALSTMCSLQKALANYSEEEQQRLVSEALRGDEYRIQCFLAMVEELGPKVADLFPTSPQ